MFFYMKRLRQKLALLFSAIFFQATLGQHVTLAAETDSLVAFIPGFMGSIIEECSEDCQSKCQIIWGRDADQYKLSINEAACHKYYPYDNDTALLGILNQNVYSRIRKEITNTLVPLANVITLPYDWRRNPSTIAEQLNDGLCAASKTGRPTNLYLMAHSFGGLALKQWLRTFANEGRCRDGSSRDWRVLDIAFVATPHLGTPKTIESLLGGYKVTGNTFHRIFGYMSIKELEAAVTQSAPKMESTYSLLPVLSHSTCNLVFSSAQKLEKQFPVIEPFGVFTTQGNWQAGRLEPINIYDAAQWRRWKLLRPELLQPETVPNLAPFQSFADKQLIKMQSSCPYDSIDPTEHLDDQFGRTAYVFGSIKDSTPYSVALTPFANGHFTVLRGEGDGTVPNYSAVNAPLLRASERSYEMRATDENHLSILSSQVLSDLLHSWAGRINLRSDYSIRTSTTDKTRQQREENNGVNQNAPLNDKQWDSIFDKLHYVPIDPSLYNHPQFRQIMNDNKDALRRAGLVQIDDLNKQSRNGKSPYQKAFFLFVGAQLFPRESVPHYRLLASSMMAAFDAQDRPTAIGLAKEVKALRDKVFPNGPEGYDDVSRDTDANEILRDYKADKPFHTGAIGPPEASPAWLR